MIRTEGTARDRGIIIDSRALEDPELSFRAKGVLAYLHSRPGGRVADVKRLEGVSAEKRAAIETALKELVDKGYVAWVEETRAVRADGSEGDVTVGGSMDDLFADLPGPTRREKRTPDSAIRPAASGKRDESRERVERIIDRLNLLRERSWDWAQYTPLSAKYAKNVEHIRGRFRDGYEEGDLVLVLEYLAAVDGGKEESRRYFNCVTPFNTKNFERNLALARDWEAKGRRGLVERLPGTSRGKDYYLREREGDG